MSLMAAIYNQDNTRIEMMAVCIWELFSVEIFGNVKGEKARQKRFKRTLRRRK